MIATPKAQKFTVTITFTTHPDSEHLGDQQEIRDEVQSWLESLRATVHAITVVKT